MIQVAVRPRSVTRLHITCGSTFALTSSYLEVVRLLTAASPLEVRNNAGLRRALVSASVVWIEDSAALN
jgi:hypothetical protein